MKKTCKFFIYITIALCFLFILSSSFLSLFSDPYSKIYFSKCLWIYSIVPMIVGIIALENLKTATSKKDLTTIGILTLIFSSLVGGILMLCLTDDDLKDNKVLINDTKNNNIQELDNQSLNNENKINNTTTPIISNDSKNQDNINNNTLTENKQNNENNEKQTINQDDSINKELNNAKNLYDNGIIDKEQYKNILSKIINKI
jgi:hypothetical protein